MKSLKIRNILRTLVCTILGAYILLLGILNYAPTNKMLSNYVAQELSHKIGSKVSIDNIQIGLFNRLIINNICISDRQHEILLKAYLATTKIELRSLFKQQLSLRTVSLLDADVNLYQQKADSAANYQFLIDAFASKDHKPKSGINLRINSIILRRVNIRYDKRFLPHTPHKFNPSHIGLADINANISLKNITTKQLDLRVRALSFKEQSGLCLNDMHFKFSATPTAADIEDFSLDMPHTHIRQGSLLATYNIQRGIDQLPHTLRIGATLNKIQVSTADIRPLLGNMPKGKDLTLRISTTLLLTPGKLQLNQLTITDKQHDSRLKADVTLKYAPKRVQELYLTLSQCHVSKALTSNLLSWVKLDNKSQNIVKAVGDIDIKGNAAYQAGGTTQTTLDVQTAIGHLTASASIKGQHASSHINVKSFALDKLLANKSLPTQIDAMADIRATIVANKRLESVSIKLQAPAFTWNNYNFRNIEIEADHTPRTTQFDINSNDPNAKFNAIAKLSLVGKQIVGGNADINIQNLHLANLGLESTPLHQAQVSAHIKADLDKWQKGALPHGTLQINNLDIQNGPRGNYSLNQFNASITSDNTNRQTLKIQSDFADAYIEGNMSLERIKQSVTDVLNRSLPGLVDKAQPYPPLTPHDQWLINAKLKDAEALYKLANIKFTTDGPLHIHGTFAPMGRTSIVAFTNQLNVSSQAFIRPSIYLSGQGQDYHCLIQTQKAIANSNYRIAANLTTRHGALHTQLSWSNQEDKDQYYGSVESTTEFVPSRNGVNLNMDISPTQFALSDTIWHIASGHLSYINKRLAMSGIQLSHASQSLTIDGTIAPGQSDSIVASLNGIDIDYILNLINFDAVSFGGRATGQAIFTQKEHQPQFHANLTIPHFTFNNGLMGHANIHANWNKGENRINIDADMKLPHTPNYGTQVHGYVSLAEKGLSLNITPHHTDLAFLNRCIDGIFGDFKGDATGHIRLYGPFKKLDFEGEVSANCQAKVLATGVNYKVQDGNVRFEPGAFVFNDFNLYDKHSGKGKANGVLRHTHLKKLNYTFDITANHMLCYDQPQQAELPFFCTTSATGNIHLAGWPSHFTADIALRPDAPSQFTYNLDNQTALSKDDRMIRFHAMQQQAPAGLIMPNADTLRIHQAPPTTAGNEPTDMQLNFMIDLTPATQIKIITDGKSGDAITAWGQGPLRARWHNKGGFDIYGSYTLVRGDYNISLQDIIKKSLKLQDGSSITFAGDPLNARLNLKALYTVNGVSLNDLNYGAGFSNKMVKADCILNIGGVARAPKVDFDLDLHNISDDEKQMVHQLISTDEDMSKQVMCLLGMGRFMTTTNTATGANINNQAQQQSSAAMRSFLSTTLTGQLNSAISSMLGNNSKWSFGTNFMPGTEGWNNSEVDGLVQGRLFNDRLLFNGNFGYRESSTYSTNFVGDFDIRYLLTPRGSVSLRAYSETNDRYFTKSSLTTQGIGITLQREFNKLKELFKRDSKKRLK